MRRQTERQRKLFALKAEITDEVTLATQAELNWLFRHIQYKIKRINQFRPKTASKRPRLQKAYYVSNDLWETFRKRMHRTLFLALLTGAVKFLELNSDLLTTPIQINSDAIARIIEPEIGERVVQVESTIKRMVGRKVVGWYNSPGTTMKNLIDQLKDQFGDVRARRIAQTEVTHLNSRVQEHIANEIGVTEWWWSSRQDSLVCRKPLTGPDGRTYKGCRELHGKVFQIGQPMPPYGSHPNCRCVPILMTRSIVKPAKTLAGGTIEENLRIQKADWQENEHPRDNDGKFTSGAGDNDGHATQSKPKAKLQESLEQQSNLYRGNVGKKEMAFASNQEAVIRYGQSYKPQPLPKGIKRGKNKKCYMNAFQLATSRKDLTYVEGYAVPDFIDLPIEHAWCVDEAGNVIDNTWETPGVAYHGIPFTDDFIMQHASETGVYGVFGYEAYKKYAEKGFPEDAIAKPKVETHYTETPEYKSFASRAEKWLGGSDSESRAIAYDIAKRNPELHRALLDEQFKGNVPETATLYRVGNPYGEGISSFFTSHASAKSYQKRMGVDSIHAFKTDTQNIVPSGAGSGEVWCDFEDIEPTEIEKLLKAQWDESKHPRKQDGKFAPKGQGEEGAPKVEEKKGFYSHMPDPVNTTSIDKIDLAPWKRKLILDIYSGNVSASDLISLADESTQRLARDLAKSAGIGFVTNPIKDIADAHSYRSNVKDNLVKDILVLANKEDPTITYDNVNDFIQNWAQTSNKTEDANNAQVAISELFGVELSDFQKEIAKQYAGVHLTAEELQDKKDDYIVANTLFLDEIYKSYELLKKQSIDENWDTKVQNLEDFITSGMGKTIIKNLADSMFPHIDDIISSWAFNSVSGKKWHSYISALVSDLLEKYGGNSKPEDVMDFVVKKTEAQIDDMVDLYDKNQNQSTGSSKIDKAKTIIKAMYRNTQDWFKKHGYDPDALVTLFRGGNRKWNIPGGSVLNEAVIHGNAAESWSLNALTARGFGSTVLMADVPVKNILSTFYTGYGCLVENEVVVIGGANNKAFVIASPYDKDKNRGIDKDFLNAVDDYTSSTMEKEVLTNAWLALTNKEVKQLESLNKDEFKEWCDNVINNLSNNPLSETNSQAVFHGFLIDQKLTAEEQKKVMYYFKQLPPEAQDEITNDFTDDEKTMWVNQTTYEGKPAKTVKQAQQEVINEAYSILKKHGLNYKQISKVFATTLNTQGKKGFDLFIQNYNDAKDKDKFITDTINWYNALADNENAPHLDTLPITLGDYSDETPPVENFGYPKKQPVSKPTGNKIIKPSPGFKDLKMEFHAKLLDLGIQDKATHDTVNTMDDGALYNMIHEAEHIIKTWADMIKNPTPPKPVKQQTTKENISTEKEVADHAKNSWKNAGFDDHQTGVLLSTLATEKQNDLDAILSAFDEHPASDTQYWHDWYNNSPHGGKKIGAKLEQLKEQP